MNEWCFRVSPGNCTPGVNVLIYCFLTFLRKTHDRLQLEDEKPKQNNSHRHDTWVAWQLNSEHRKPTYIWKVGQGEGETPEEHCSVSHWHFPALQLPPLPRGPRCSKGRVQILRKHTVNPLWVMKTTWTTVRLMWNCLASYATTSISSSITNMKSTEAQKPVLQLV